MKSAQCANNQLFRKKLIKKYQTKRLNQIENLNQINFLNGHQIGSNWKLLITTKKFIP
jgi:hypothetical protein